MAKGQQSISVTKAEFKVLEQAKKNFTLLTGLSPSWGAFFVAMSFGVLAPYAIRGFEARCPSCESVMEMRLISPILESSEVSGESALSSSKEQTARRKQ